MSSILVEFKFDGNPKSEVASLSYEQYCNLRELPITVECKIVKNKKITLSKKDTELLSKKLEQAFKNDKSHTQRLSE